jgi:hypothetical protein
LSTTLAACDDRGDNGQVGESQNAVAFVIVTTNASSGKDSANTPPPQGDQDELSLSKLAAASGADEVLKAVGAKALAVGRPTAPFTLEALKENPTVAGLGQRPAQPQDLSGLLSDPRPARMEAAMEQQTQTLNQILAELQKQSGLLARLVGGTQEP